MTTNGETMNDDEKALPTAGQWYKRVNRGSAAAARYKHRPTDIVKIDAIEPDGGIVCLRFDGHNGSGEPIFGRRTTIDPKTWTKDAGRYTLTHEPVPAMLTRTEAARRLGALGRGAGWVFDVLDRAHDALREMEDSGPAIATSLEAVATMTILRAYTAHLMAMPTAADPMPEPKGPVTLDAMLAEQRAMRAEMAALRAEMAGLTKALKEAFPQLKIPFNLAA